MFCVLFFFFQAEDGIRDAQESRGLGDVYKRQGQEGIAFLGLHFADAIEIPEAGDVQIEVGLFVGSGHGESPENNEAETHRTQAREVWNPRVG